MKQIRLKDRILLVNCCKSRNYHPEDIQCPIYNNDAHGDGDSGCNLDADDPHGDQQIPPDCSLEDAL